MRRISDILKGLTALTIAACIVFVVPAGLISVIGWPLPTTAPSVDLINTHITDGDVPDLFVIKSLAIIVWLSWAQLAIGLILETSAAIRGKAARRAPILPGIQLFAAKLVTWATLMLSALGPIRPVVALPLQPVSAAQPIQIQAPANHLNLADANLDSTPAPAENSATAAQQYLTSGGDSWWSLAEDLLGDGMRWHEIRDLNLDQRQPDGTVVTRATESVRSGWLLTVPADASLNDTDPRSEGEPPDVVDQVVTVEPGDHFWRLAENQLAAAWGRQPTDTEIAPYWSQVVEQNLDRLAPPHDPNLIYPNQTFVMPATPPNPDIDIDLNGADIPPPRTPAEVEPSVGDDARVPSPSSESEPSPSAEAAPLPPFADQAPPSRTAEQADRAPATPIVEDDASNDEIIKPLAITGGLALLGGVLLFALRGLRRIQAARRRPGTVIDPPDTDASELEERLRAIATDGEDVRYLTATNSYLSHQLEQHSDAETPSVIAARAGTFGVELLLDEPCEPVEGFILANRDKMSWRLHPDITARAMEADTIGDAHPFAPALLVAGSTDVGDLLIDFEQLGATAVAGDPEQVAAFLRGLLASAIAAPWATQCRLVAIGLGSLDSPDFDRVEQPDDPTECALKLGAEMTAVADHLDRSPYEGRVEHHDVYHPTIIVIGPGTEHAAIAQHLAPIADLAYTPLAVVSANPINTEYGIEIADRAATLEPFGLGFEPLEITTDELVNIEHLIANASDTQSAPPRVWVDEELTTEGPASPGEQDDQPIELDNESSIWREGDVSLAPSAINGNGSSKAQPSPSPEARGLIQEIVQARPIEVRILGRRPTVAGLEEEPSAKLEAIIAYLAFHEDVAAQRLREEFWPASKGRTAADTAIMRVRALLGQTDGGESRMPSARGSGSYSLHEDVGCDWTRVTLLVAAARDATAVDEAEFLDAACELIEGHVAADASPAHYSWLLRDPGTYTAIETTLVDAAHRRAELALEAGDLARANWAARKGLAVVDGQESLYRVRMRAAAVAGDTDAVNAVYREAQRAAESYGFDEEVQPETHALYESLTRQQGAKRVEPAD